MKTFFFLTTIINAYEELKEFKQLSKNILDTEWKVIKSLYKPAIADDVFYFDSKQIEWINEDFKEQSDHLDAFIDSIRSLSDYYWRINPPLSAALFAIWDSSQQIRQGRSLWRRLFPRKKNELLLFLNISGLIGTTAIRYADINLAPVEVPDSRHKFDEYKKLADITVLNLSNLHKQSD